MYEDLVQAQQPWALERFVLTSVIPSLLLTSLLHADVVWARRARELPRLEELRRADDARFGRSAFRSGGATEAVPGFTCTALGNPVDFKLRSGTGPAR